ncbi:MAG TPA: fatty acid desaturase [Solirubrobacteraceae bacterium]|jgi:stearoyl-CoA desaturase (delta-9 desaturase)
MTPAHRISNLAGAIVPFVAFLAAILLLWNRLVDWSDLAVMTFMYVITALGVTVGFHRLLTHRSFATSMPLQYVLAILGSVSVQGPVISWVADHRKHHAFTDKEGDPHSPHTHDSGLKGLWYAHMGWLFDRQGQAAYSKFAKDLVEDRGMRRINRLFPLWVALGIVVPFGLGLAIDGTLAGGLTAALWGGLVRIFLLHHITWSINSICHYFGTRRFAVDDHSTNVFWLALPSMGESWHHNHHAFPRAAVHGMRWWELDPTGWVIRGLKKTGLAWNVVEITPERQRAKEMAATAA